MQPDSILNRFAAARRDPSLAVLEGFHVVKHALRFGAGIDLIVSSNLPELGRLVEFLAPDLAARLPGMAVEVSGTLFEQLSPQPHRTEVIAIARRRVGDLAAVIADPQPGPVVFLERPSHLGNIGAVVRVAAGAGAVGVITTGEHDPWHPVALRGGAGLQYAVPTTRAEGLPECDRPLLAVHPDGEELSAASVPDRALLAFGEERGGLSEEVLQRAEKHLRIPMPAGVSSLNLATAVAVVLYAWRLHHRDNGE